jgi:hypothetical protein
MFHIAGAFAELEREIIRERVRAGLANAKRRGRTVGRPGAVVNPLQEVFQKASQGLSGREIAKTAGISEATVRRILRKRFNDGGRYKASELPDRPRPLSTLDYGRNSRFLSRSPAAGPGSVTHLARCHSFGP